jgi:hypothetical protein
MDRYKSGTRSSVKKFDGKNYKAWAFNMQLLLSRERGMSIINRTETAPAGPTEEIPAELDKNGEPIKGTGRPGTAASNAYTDYNWRFWEALRLIFESLEEGIQSNYMSITEPAELWEAIRHDYVDELRKGQFYVRRELYNVKLEACGSVDKYVVTIQNLLDEYKLGSKEPDDKIGVREHVFYLLNGVPEGGDWDVELRLIHDKLDSEDWYKEPTKIIKKLQTREAELRKLKGLSPDVALYTKAAAISKNPTAVGKQGRSDVKKDKDKEKRVCTHCKKEGHLEEKCWTKHGKPDWKKDKEKEEKEDEDENSSTATANFTSTSTIDSLWMAVEDSAVTMRDFYLDGACDAHACNRRDLFDSETFVELKEGDRKVRGFDGSQQSAKGIGTIRLPMCLGKGRPVRWARIPDVLYMPGSANLISQGTLTDRGIRIELINGYGAKLYNKAGGLIATARQRNKMLPLDIAWQHMPREGVSVPKDPRSFAFMATGHTMGGDSSISSVGSPVGSPVGPPAGPPLHGRWAPHDSLPFAFKAGTGHGKGGDAEFKLCHRSLARIGLEVLKHLAGSMDDDGIPTFGGECDCISCVRNR